MILLNKQQLVCGAKDLFFQLPFLRYNYCERNEVPFLWKDLLAVKITLDIKGAWKPSLKNSKDEFLMEKLINMGYTKAVLEVLNDIRVFNKVITLSDIGKGWGWGG